jgi:uncharacterized membrane protein
MPSIGERLRRLLGGKRGKSPPQVSANLVLWIILAFIIFVSAGGIYDILNNAPAITVNQSTGEMSSVADINGQTITESIFSMIMITFMFAGLFAAKRSMGVAYDRRKANTMLMLGVALILFGISGSFYLLLLKSG